MVKNQTGLVESQKQQYAYEVADGAQVYEEVPYHVEESFVFLFIEIGTCRIEYSTGEDKNLQTEIGVTNKHRQYKNDRPTHH